MFLWFILEVKNPAPDMSNNLFIFSLMWDAMTAFLDGHKLTNARRGQAQMQGMNSTKL